MRDKISEEVSTALWYVGAIKVSVNQPFELASGNRSPVYIDCRVLISYPEERTMITDFAARLYEQEGLRADYIAGGETAGIPFAAWLAQTLNLPFVYVRKKPKGYGLGAQIEGDLEPNKTVLLYEDLITDGTSKLNFINGIRGAKCEVKNCLVIFDRDQGGESKLRAENITLHSLTNIVTALCVGVEKGYIEEEALAELQEYLEDSKQWHQKKGYEFHDLPVGRQD